MKLLSIVGARPQFIRGAVTGGKEGAGGDTALYHLGFLEYFGLVSRFKSKSLRFNSRTRGLYRSCEKIISPILQEPPQRRIIEFLFMNEGTAVQSHSTVL